MAWNQPSLHPATKELIKNQEWALFMPSNQEPMDYPSLEHAA